MILIDTLIEACDQSKETHSTSTIYAYKEKRKYFEFEICDNEQNINLLKAYYCSALITKLKRIYIYVVIDEDNKKTTDINNVVENIKRSILGMFSNAKICIILYIFSDDLLAPAYKEKQWINNIYVRIITVKKETLHFCWNIGEITNRVINERMKYLKANIDSAPRENMHIELLHLWSVILMKQEDGIPIFLRSTKYDEKPNNRFHHDNPA